uniref:ethanolamine kinase n=2 Tax=Clastoptera arizonana TaxID=38151 RepID=A0A1B6CIE0_9HEMI
MKGVVISCDTRSASVPRVVSEQIQTTMNSSVDEDMSNVPHIELNLVHERIEEGAIEILKNIRPDWNIKDVNFRVFTNGITNKLLGCFNSSCKTDGILVRVYGHNTDLMIDRKAETRNFKLLQGAGYAPPLYATFTNGLAYKFVPGIVLTEDLVRSPKVYPMIARMVACIHKLDYGISVTRSPSLWKKCAKYISLIPNTYSKNEKQSKYLNIVKGGVDFLRQELDSLESNLREQESPIVFCHNDLLLGNIILEEDSVTFIDYEYASYNYQAFDIGNHFDEFAGVATVDYSLYPDRDLQWDWLRIYLEEYNCDIENYQVTEKDIERLYVQVNKFAIAASFMWGVWSLVQAHVSDIDFDFMDYADIRLTDYFSRKEEVLSLTLPR